MTFRACKFCEWYRAYSESEDGECRVSPPQVDHKTGEGFWPIVLETGFCSLFKRIENCGCYECKYISKNESLDTYRFKCKLNNDYRFWNSLCFYFKPIETESEDQGHQNTAKKTQDQDPSCDDQCRCGEQQLSNSEQDSED